MLGTETEFGIYGGWSLARANAIQESVAASQPTLPAVKGGVFLANGARVYVDFGRHNEYATPETHDPAALVRHELAGRELMAQAAARHQLSLLCSNFDPHTRSTWGTHENYEVFGLLDSRKLDQLYTHLVTRIIYTGAGGIDPDHAGVRLILSPRANQMRAAHSEQGHTLPFAHLHQAGSLWATSALACVLRRKPAQPDRQLFKIRHHRPGGALPASRPGPRTLGLRRWAPADIIALEP